MKVNSTAWDCKNEKVFETAELLHMHFGTINSLPAISPGISKTFLIIMCKVQTHTGMMHARTPLKVLPWLL